MATDLTAVAIPVTGSITLTNANVAYEVQLPAAARSIMLEMKTNAGEVSFTGTDTVDLGDANMGLPADTWVDIDIRRGRANPGSQSIYLQTATGGTKCAYTITN